MEDLCEPQEMEARRAGKAATCVLIQGWKGDLRFRSEEQMEK